jgi:ribosome-binding factor A
MGTQRPERVQEALRQELSRIVQNDIKDPRLGFLTITKVELTKDLRYAKVYFSVLGESKDKYLALKGLNSAKGYIKGLLSDRIKLRFMPEIAFKIDESLEHTKEIYDILDKLKKEKDNEKGDRGDKEI